MRAWLIGFPVVLLGMPGFVQAQGPNSAEILDEAESAFRLGVESKTRLLLARKHFGKATDEYLKLHGHGHRSAALYRSLGNTAVLADRWPEAIWAYQAGLKLNPNDRVMRKHLAHVRTKVLYPPAGQGRPEADVWPPWLYRPTALVFLFVCFVSYSLAWAGAMALSRESPSVFFGSFAILLLASVGVMVFLSPKPWRVLFTCVAIWLAALAGGALWQTQRQVKIDNETPLVVLATNTDFHRGNGPSYPKHPVLPVLPRGLEARQTHRRGDWLQIRLTTGESGWVHASQTLIDAP